VRTSPRIMATIGPTLEKPEDLRRAVEAGARWFRLPCGYRQRAHLEHAQCIRQVARQTGVALELLMDLPSSRPRTGKIDDLHLEPGARVRFWDPGCGPVPDAEGGVASVPLPGLAELVDKIGRGHRVWFCDGRLEFRADEVGDGMILTHLERGAIPLKSSNSIYLPDSSSPFVMVTADDITLLESFAAANVVPDWIALSLVSSAEDVRIGARQIQQLFGDRVRVMAKIETAEAVEQADSILAECAGIMVARGDLGPAVEFIRLPEAQERLVEAAHRVGKTVVVATQVLEYFAEVGVPQRSELSGLSVLAAQSPDAVMLGKETVYSPRPIEAIRLAQTVLDYEARRLAERRRQLPRSLAPSSGPPVRVAIEGPNGVGKSHLCRLLGERFHWLLVRGVPACWEEGPMKLRMIRDADWLASAMYFLSGVIESAREASPGPERLAIMDRSLWSTLAVHYAHDPARMETLFPLLDLAADRLPVPHLTVVLEAAAETCQRRIAGKAGSEREFDAASPDGDDFHRREREFYHWLASQGPKVVFVDTDDRDPDAVCQTVAELIRKSLPCCTC